jgi:hypothetical protein
MASFYETTRSLFSLIQVLFNNTPMKKILLMLCLFVGLFQAKGQNFTGGLIGGINGAQLDGDGVGGYYKPGLVLGFAAGFPINEKWTIEPEFMFSQKGSRTTMDQFLDQGIPYVHFKLNYVDLPIMATYKLRPDLHFQIGLSPNVLLGAEEEDANGLTADRRDFFSTIDIMGAAGLEYRILPKLGLNMRFCYSVLSTSKGDITQIPVYNQIQNRVNRVGFYNNVLSFTLRYYMFGAREE